MKAIVWAMVIASTGLATVSVSAQDAIDGHAVGSTDTRRDGLVLDRVPGSLSASELLGTAVIGTGGQRVGTVRDILIDRDGRVTAVTVDVGDFLGIPTKTVALASRSLRFVPAGPSGIESAAGATADPAGGRRSVLVPGIGMVDHVEVDFTQQQLEAAPTFGG